MESMDAPLKMQEVYTNQLDAGRTAARAATGTSWQPCACVHKESRAQPATTAARFKDYNFGILTFGEYKDWSVSFFQSSEGEDAHCSHRGVSVGFAGLNGLQAQRAGKVNAV